MAGPTKGGKGHYFWCISAHLNKADYKELSLSEVDWETHLDTGYTLRATAYRLCGQVLQAGKS